MSRVDFYVLDGERDQDRLALACRLTEKAFHLGHRTYLHASSALQAQQLDELLWTYRQNSFLPHEQAQDDADAECPILIGFRSEPPRHGDLLVNLGDEIPPFAENFERVVELVGGGEPERAQARERYRRYRERGYELQSHQVGQRG
jgi:DNA polymerase-3 subunit chi